METPDPNEVMCMCSGTKRSAILRMFEQGMDIEEISQRSGALSGCGGCEWDIKALIVQLTEQQYTKKPSTE